MRLTWQPDSDLKRGPRAENSLEITVDYYSGVGPRRDDTLPVFGELSGPGGCVAADYSGVNLSVNDARKV